MEIDLITNDMSEEDPFQVCNDNYNEQDLSTFEEERCGICMDIVIDRGVLDCCQHWFCFACIDNWATITNLCPLCQNEFQLITCVPVYDTTGSNKVEDDSRDDDWCIEGKNSSLSFPSYYIDENAVVCLDGDDCKIRSGSKVDDDLNFDTSIACDSCDIWYHAFCVGFDPENTTDSTWLCPRCVVCEMPQRSVTASLQRPSNQCGSGSANATGESSVEAAFSRKVSVSVADVGETAVVVSMVGGNQWSEEPKMNSLSTPEVDMDQKSESFTPRSDANSSKVESSSNKRKSTEPKMDVQELELSLSHDKLFSLSSKTSVPSECNDNCADKEVKKPDGVDGFRISSRDPFGESGIPEVSESDPSISLHLGLSVGSFLSGDHVKNDGIENQAAVGVQQHKPLDESFLLADCIAHHVVVGDVVITSVKRKHTSCSEDVISRIEDEEIKANLETEISAKKVKTMGKIQMISSMDHAVKSERRDLEKEDATCDIMSIVQDTDRRPLKGLSSPITTDKSSKEREAGLRVKKIMRRAARDKESSIIVQKLRKEIREAIRNKSSIDFGKKLFDPKLLAAFRTAVAGPGTEPAKKTAHLVVKAKKSMLQKGKSRENLTKKIYGINGRRKRAWDRECEVEFWKHRCMRTTKPEKIETLKSVLDVLRSNSENGGIEQQSGLHTANPILSRLYLADTSVFPRKDDIKPLAALKVASKAGVNEKQHTSVEKQNTSVEKAFLINQLVKMPGTVNDSTKAGLPLFDKEKKESVSCLKGNAASSKVNLNRSSGGPSHSGSKVNAQKEVVVKTDDIKSDKRKWALQVLARKTAVSGRNATQEKHEDSAVLKGNYPLLAQLPVDMRPVLAPTRQNKVPISIRQAQLNRLTEHFLRKANQPFIHRTAETELAVADAVNIEKEVADRSNSKLVYVNLCSQELLRRSSNSNTDRDVESDPSPPSAVSTDRSEQGTSNLSIDPDAEEALRNAGLLSDSPPNSPHEEMKDGDEDDSSKTIEEGPDNIFGIDDKVNDGDADNPSKKIEEGPENIFEIDFHPELDIYGDFEYDLEDEDYIGASAINVSKLQSEEESTRMKVVFSTLSSDRPNNVPICENSEGMGIPEILKDSSSLLKRQSPDTEFKFSNMEGRADEPCRPSEPLPGEGAEELSLEECEELYGPDKEPLIERFAGATEKQYGPVGTEALAEDRTLESDENYASNQVRASELGNQSYVETHIVATTDHNSTGGRTSPNNSQTSENVQRENKSNADSNKQSDNGSSVSKKVEAYIKEHLRPLCKSGVISVEQYRRAVAKTTDKVMKYHSKDKNASFLIKEGEKVKKLAEQYVEAAQQKEK